MHLPNPFHVYIIEKLETSLFRDAQKNGILNFYEHPSSIATSPGIHVYYYPEIALANKSIVDALKGKPVHALITRPYPIDTYSFKNLPELKLIIRAGSGVNSIDLVSAKTQGVIVENTPGQNAIAAAEYTIAVLMDLGSKRFITKHAAMVAEAFNNKSLNRLPPPLTLIGHELYGRVLGIIGYGHIGSHVARIAKALGLNILIASRNQKLLPEGMRQVSLNELYKESDIISLHTPLTPETQHMINDHALGLMKEGVTLINAARPQLIDPDALSHHMSRLSGLAIDGDTDQIEAYLAIALQHPKVESIITHHIGDATKESEEKLTRQVILQLQGFVIDGMVINQVT